MRRIMSFAISVIYTFIKFCIMKAFNWKGFFFHAIERFSPNVVTEFSRNSVIRIGRRVKSRSGTKIQVRSGATLVFGDDTRINYNCIISCRERIEIGYGTEIGPSVYIYDHDHDYKLGLGLDQFITEPIRIGNNCWIGAQTIILRGTHIGDNCVIGAGSVLRGNYPEGSLIVQKRPTACINTKENMQNESL